MKKPIDENMIVRTVQSRDGFTVCDVRNAPFSIHGAWYDDRFYRIPRQVSERVSKNIFEMYDMPAGGRVRFATDSKRILLSAEIRKAEESACLSATAIKGFDIYADDSFVGVFSPRPALVDGKLESIVNLGEGKMRDITISFPLYAGVAELYIGIEDGASLLPAKPYKHQTPIVYYGSSITNGAAASRPGMTYEAMLSRRLNVDHHNLGFGGSAKGEREMAEYIATLDMSVFVMDYDYNAPNPEHLEATHYPFYKIIRDKNPTLPIVLISAPCRKRTENNKARRAIIKATYDRARAEGDENIYFVNGAELLPFDDNEFTVDSVHPTDLGFYFIANGLEPLLKKLLGD